ncbi:MAG: HDOD domain-containing protein [Gammaproteobacteria bacterium]|nr:HDOD domain-containing protein [Gammaproteobacteria bacterium]
MTALQPDNPDASKIAAQNARSWLESHRERIPPFDFYHQQIVEVLQEGVASLAEIADIIVLDPGLSTALLQKVNAKLLNSRRPCVDTVHTAIGYLGKQAVADLVNDNQPLSNKRCEPEVLSQFRQLLGQNYHALAQIDGFLKIQGIDTVDDIRGAVLLYNLAETQLCLLDTARYHEYRQRLHYSPNKTDHATDVFGFEFDQLSIHLVQHWHLPKLLSESFTTEKNISRKARLIQLSGAVVHQAESGWYHQAMQNVIKDCAEFLNLNEHETRQGIISAALQNARDPKIRDILPAASRLVLLPDLARPSAAKKTKAPSLGDHLKSLLKSPAGNLSQLVSALLTSLHEHAGFSRVVVMLLSSDRTKLATRADRGLSTESPFLKLQLEVAQSGLFKSLLQKPQAIHINATNYRKYENSLPGKFKATSLCNNFVMMSIFSGNNPVGVVYCDRKGHDNDIDKARYHLFKTDTMLTSKALTFLAKRQAQASA